MNIALSLLVCQQVNFGAGIVTRKECVFLKMFTKARRRFRAVKSCADAQGRF